MTARLRALATVVNDTTSSSPSGPNATARAARAPSVAYPWPQADRASRQPTSVHGVNGACHFGWLSPTNPTNSTGREDLDGPAARTPGPQQRGVAVGEGVGLLLVERSTGSSASPRGRR